MPLLVFNSLWDFPCLKKILYAFFLVMPLFLCAQGSVCFDPAGENGADPFCSTTGIVFPNCNSSTSGCNNFSENGPNYGCLSTQPFPAWYFLQIETSGDLLFNIVQTSNEDGTGSQLDVDFICYGPFPDPTSYCQTELTAINTVDCSYSTSFNEIMTINNAVAGEYYLVLITNFSEQPGFISFQQTNGSSGNSGSTDCSILEATLGPNQNICGSDPVDLDGETEEAIRYEWSIYNETTMTFEIIVGETDPVYTVTSSGRYQLLVEDAGGNIETDEVVITFNTEPIIAQQPLDIELCEEGGRAATFDFALNTQRIIGLQDPNEFNVSYYLTQEDANNNMNPITEQYSTTSRSIYARIANTNLSSCYIIESFEVYVNAAPDLSFSQYNYEICETIDATPLEALVSTNDILNNLTSTSGTQVDLLAEEEVLEIDDFTVSYHLTMNDVIADVNAINDNDIVFDGQILHVRVENNTTSCFNVDNIAEVVVKISQIPEANPDVLPFVQCADEVSEQNIATFNLREKDFEVSLVNNPVGTTVAYYRTIEDYNNDSPMTEEEIVAFRNAVNPQEMFAAVIDEENGCGKSSVVSFVLQVKELPVLDNNRAFDGEKVVCVDKNGLVQQVTLIGEDIGAQDGNIYLYDWTPDNIDGDNDGFEDAIFNVTELRGLQDFKLNITRLGANGEPDCMNNINPLTTEEYKITLRPSAAPVIVNYQVEETSFSGSYTITAIPVIEIGESQDYIYALNNGSYQDSPVFTNVSPGDHVITVRNKNGCQPEVKSDLIQILGYPKYFTPNGDGIHDTWTLINIEDQPTALIYIFDRSGKLLKQLIPGGEGWDGTFNGKLMSSNEYWFRVEFNEPGSPGMSRRVFTGSFSLIR